MKLADIYQELEARHCIFGYQLCKDLYWCVWMYSKLSTHQLPQPGYNTFNSLQLRQESVFCCKNWINILTWKAADPTAPSHQLRPLLFLQVSGGPWPVKTHLCQFSVSNRTWSLRVNTACGQREKFIPTLTMISRVEVKIDHWMWFSSWSTKTAHQKVAANQDVHKTKVSGGLFGLNSSSEVKITDCTRALQTCKKGSQNKIKK